MFEKIANDSFIKDIYKKTQEFEDNDINAYAYHDYDHVMNVAKTTDYILTSLNCEKEYIEEAKIAAILHDIGAYCGKGNHAERSCEMAKKYFEDNNIKLKNKDLILDAILNHSNGFDSDNLMRLSIILADKIDTSKTRNTKYGAKVIGNRQYNHIKKVIVNIDNIKLIILYKTDSKLNVKELEEYYFTRKVFKAVESFASKLKLEYEIRLNDEKWLPFFLKKE